MALVSPRNISPRSRKLSTTTAFQKACTGSRLVPREVKFPERDWKHRKGCAQSDLNELAVYCKNMAVSVTFGTS